MCSSKWRVELRRPAPVDRKVAGLAADGGVEAPRLGPVGGGDPIGSGYREVANLAGVATELGLHPDGDHDVVGGHCHDEKAGSRYEEVRSRAPRGKKSSSQVMDAAKIGDLLIEFSKQIFELRLFSALDPQKTSKSVF